MSAELFAGRYELLHKEPAGSAGPLFQARDTQDGAIVALKVFHRELPPDAPERGDIERFCAAAQACEHPRIVRLIAHVLDQGYIVREWLHGFPLVDLLRRRRELPAAEVAALLHDSAGTIDAAVAADLAPTGELLARFFICWDASLPPDELDRLRGVPVTDWSGFTVKLNPVNLSAVLPLSADETMSTMVAPLLAQAGPMLTPSAAFAEMIHQLLGAPRRQGRERRYVPVSTLNEAGNAVLRRVIEGGTPPASCAAFWKDLLDAAGFAAAPGKIPPPPKPKPVAPPPLPKRRTLRIPEAFLVSVQPGSLLRLTPRDGSFTPVHLVARPAFRIGRSLQHADFVARVMPEAPANEKLTKEIGRVHVLAETHGGRIFLHDGNGEQPSVNGSSIAGQPLAAGVPTPLEGRAVLALYRNYEIEIIPMPASADLGGTIENEAAWPGPAPAQSAPGGAVVFQPLRNQPALRQAAWLFSRLDFTLSSRGDVAWSEAGAQGSYGSFLYHRGCFWLATFAPTEAFRIGGTELPRDAAVPLLSGQSLQLGPGSYIVEVQ